MTTTLALTTLSRTSLRWLLACAALALCPSLELKDRQTLEPYASVWKRLWEQHGWTPSVQDSPLPLREVEAWLRQTDAEGRETQGKLRGWLEKRLREEEG